MTADPKSAAAALWLFIEAETMRYNKPYELTIIIIVIIILIIIVIIIIIIVVVAIATNEWLNQLINLLQTASSEQTRTQTKHLLWGSRETSAA